VANDAFSSPPDPTDAVNDAVERAVKAERDYVDGKIGILGERLDAIDRATELLNETVNRVPTDVQKEVGHIRELTDEKFSGIQTQFKERDTRQERESRDNKVAVDAAFAAQKEAASEQNKSNTLAINKSETSTIETINKLDRLFKTTTDALGDKIDDNKQRVADDFASLRQAIVELDKKVNGEDRSKQGAKEDRSSLYATLTIGMGIILFIITIASVIAATQT
jgi:hypothetical protein